MAQNNFLPFGPEATDILTDAEYAISQTRIDGVTTGIARTDIHNKLYKQCSVMVAAFAKAMQDADYDAMDTDYEELAENITQFIGSQTPSVTSVFEAGTTPPEDTRLLWIDTNNGGRVLKAYVNNAWGPVTVQVVSNDPATPATGETWILNA